MNILKIDDKGKAICEACKAIVKTTYTLRNIPFSDESGIVKNVLVGVCDQCDSVVSLPHQSTPLVKKKLDKQRGILESRVPAHFIDILNLASLELSGSIDFTATIIRYYLHNLLSDNLSKKEINRYVNSDLAKGKSQKRLSIKGKNIMVDIEKLKKITQLKSTSALIKLIILKINEDILMRKNPETIQFLKSVVAIAS